MFGFFNFFKRKSDEEGVPVTVAHKSGQDANICLSMLDVKKTLFCIDNQTILFKTGSGENRAIIPYIKELDETDKYKDFDAVPTPIGFFVKYKGMRYYYKAEYTTKRELGEIIICITAVNGVE